MAWTRYRRWLVIAGTLAVDLIALRAALPYWVKDTLNERMADMGDMGDYSGLIEAVDIDLWRGAYNLVGLEVTKTTGEVPVPIFRPTYLDVFQVRQGKVIP